VKDHRRNQRSSRKIKEEEELRTAEPMANVVFSKIPGGIVETRSHTGSIIARRVATINRAPVSWRKKKKKRRKGGGAHAIRFHLFLSSLIFSSSFNRPRFPAARWI
jgi:hypothetical protein